MAPVVDTALELLEGAVFHLLLIFSLQGAPAQAVDVGLLYASEGSCVADVKRASGMLAFIFEARDDANNFQYIGYICQREV